MAVLVVLVVAVQAVVALAPHPQPLPHPRTPVVLVGVPDLTWTPQPDGDVPWPPDRAVAAAALSEPGATGDACGLDVWATLGAGRPTTLGGSCTATVSGDRVVGWAALTAAAAARRPDARLGTLAQAVPGCVAAVGPGAPVAAARTDGTVTEHPTLDEFLRSGGRTRCPLTLVDLGTAPPSVLAPLLSRTDLTVVLAGVRRTASPQAVEALAWVDDVGAGWLTSPSTRRSGVVTLPDLTRTLVATAGGPPAGSPATDGGLLEVLPAHLSPATAGRELDALRSEPAALTTAADVLAGLVVLGAAVLLVARRRGRTGLVGVLLRAALVLPAALALTGLRPPAGMPLTAAVLVVEVLVWTLVLGVVVRHLSRRSGLPAALIASGLTLLVLTLDAASGGLLQHASLLDLRPLDGGRWYGFGNTTFAVYAGAVLVVVGWLADRGAVAAAAALAALALLCEGSPTAGADLGGVLALTPPLLWLLLRSRGVRVGPLRLAAVAAAALALGAAAAGLDWLRGPQHRTHLGGFVQDLLDGTAGALVARKAGAVVTSASGPAGLLTLGLVALCWWFVLRRRRRATAVASSLPRVVAAVAATAVLGSLANDSGLVVGAVLSVLLAVTAAALAHDAEQRSAATGPVRSGELLA